MSIRSADEIRERIATVQAKQPERDPDAYLPDSDAHTKAAQLTILYWVLEENCDPIAIYDRYQRLQNTLTTADQDGTAHALRLSTKRETLRWVAGLEPPFVQPNQNHPDYTNEAFRDRLNEAGLTRDPRTLYDRVNEIEEALFDVYSQVRQRAHETDEPVTVEGGNDVPVDLSYLRTQLETAENAASEARLTLLNDYTDKAAADVVLGPSQHHWDFNDLDDASFMTVIGTLLTQRGVTITSNAFLNRACKLNETAEYFTQRQQSALEDALEDKRS